MIPLYANVIFDKIVEIFLDSRSDTSEQVIKASLADIDLASQIPLETPTKIGEKSLRH